MEQKMFEQLGLPDEGKKASEALVSQHAMSANGAVSHFGDIVKKASTTYVSSDVRKSWTMAESIYSACVGHIYV